MNMTIEQPIDRASAHGETRPIPFQPPRYSYGFADEHDAPAIAAMGDAYPLPEVHASLARGDDEWIVARRGRRVVAVVRLRGPRADAPVVAAEHCCLGLGRYLTHLADVWVRAMSLPAAA
jgi:hypothetical protein